MKLSCPPSSTLSRSSITFVRGAGSGRLEYLYGIQATNLEGIMIYSKGKLVPQPPDETFYFLVSSKKAL